MCAYNLYGRGWHSILIVFVPRGDVVGTRGRATDTRSGALGKTEKMRDVEGICTVMADPGGACKEARSVHALDA